MSLPKLGPKWSVGCWALISSEILMPGLLLLPRLRTYSCKDSQTEKSFPQEIKDLESYSLYFMCLVARLDRKYWNENQCYAIFTKSKSMLGDTVIHVAIWILILVKTCGTIWDWTLDKEGGEWDGDWRLENWKRQHKALLWDRWHVTQRQQICSAHMEGGTIAQYAMHTVCISLGKPRQMCSF